MGGLRGRDARLLALVVATLVAASAASRCGDDSTPGPPTTPSPLPVTERVLVGAGDIGQCGLPGAELTARLLDRIDGTVFTAGDNAYFQGTAEQFRDCYHPTWGRHKGRTRPAPGNHEYESPDAAPYFAYFGEAAAPSAPGFYSFPLGAWRIYSLNSNIDISATSSQLLWLRRELQANPSLCSLVIAHHPLFASGPNGGHGHVVDLWRVMYETGVEVVVSGDEHLYERFARQTPDGRPDPTLGVRQFIVGTGGAELYRFARPRLNSEVRGEGTWGVIRFTLRATDYAWEFVPVDGGAFRDSGTETCH
jgi:hypothetical protein